MIEWLNKLDVRELCAATVWVLRFQKVCVIRSVRWNNDLDWVEKTNPCLYPCLCRCCFQSLISKDKYLSELFLSTLIMKIFGHMKRFFQFYSFVPFCGCTKSVWMHSLSTIHNTHRQKLSFTHTCMYPQKHTSHKNVLWAIKGKGMQRYRERRKGQDDHLQRFVASDILQMK